MVGGRQLSLWGEKGLFSAWNPWPKSDVAMVQKKMTLQKIIHLSSCLNRVPSVVVFPKKTTWGIKVYPENFDPPCLTIKCICALHQVHPTSPKASHDRVPLGLQRDRWFPRSILPISSPRRSSNWNTDIKAPPIWNKNIPLKKGVQPPKIEEMSPEN